MAATSSRIGKTEFKYVSEHKWNSAGGCRFFIATIPVKARTNKITIRRGTAIEAAMALNQELLRNGFSPVNNIIQ